MHRILVLAAALLAIPFATARAEDSGLDIAWNACTGSGAETYDKTINCLGNGTQRIVASFTLADPIARMRDAAWTIDIQFEAAQLPSWWVPDGVPRLALEIAATGGTCEANPWSPSPDAVASVPALQVLQASPSRLRVVGTQSFLPGEERAIAAGVRSYSHTVLVRGPEATLDAECLGKACIVFSHLRLTDADGMVTALNSPRFQGHLTWQGNSLIRPCPAATPTRDVTWGSIKALYR